MFYRRKAHPLPQEGPYLIIPLLLLANVSIGVILMLLGGEVWDNPLVSRGGFWLAIVSAVLYLFFRWIARREARRHEQRAR
ncbi:MAG TPA: hypothetical protein VKY54_00880 [Kiloniellales bacterium]|jgi:uncharacterized membrane protein YvlD (DUF360 family)|nr:hypothetical protein [Kiloniellales bacterium]